MNASRLLITTPVALGDKYCYLWPAQSTRQQQQQQQSAESWAATKARIKQHCCCYCCCPRPPARPSPSLFPPSLQRSRLEIAFLHGVENCKKWKKIDSFLHTNMMAITTTRSGNNNITATTTTTDRKREGEREREETTERNWRDDRQSESVILGPTSCPRKYFKNFIICPYYPSCCPLKIIPRLNQAKAQKWFLVAALWGQQPKAQKWYFTRCALWGQQSNQCSEFFSKEICFLPNICSKWFDSLPKCFFPPKYLIFCPNNWSKVFYSVPKWVILGGQHPIILDGVHFF
jgi:hypothetical protein